jgi:hypothetical protein
MMRERRRYRKEKMRINGLIRGICEEKVGDWGKGWKIRERRRCEKAGSEGEVVE